jgi:hypothetical protein
MHAIVIFFAKSFFNIPKLNVKFSICSEYAFIITPLPTKKILNGIKIVNRMGEEATTTGNGSTTL